MRKKVKKTKPGLSDFKLSLNIFSADSELDFHDLGPLTPFDVEEYLNKFIEEQYYSGSSKLLIITGKGYKVRPQVEKLLKLNKRVKEFRRAGYFNGQDGAFEVELG